MVFSGLAKKYAALHLGEYSDEELSLAKNLAERIEGCLLKLSIFYLISLLVCEKRLSAGWFTYSLLEFMQRNFISGPIHCNIDDALEYYHPKLREGFFQYWSRHRCNVRLFNNLGGKPGLL